VTGTDEMNNEYLPEPPLAVFTIEIAAPGGSSADWRLSPSQELPLAENARQIVERFDFKAEVIELMAHHDADTSRPGIILIDPRFMTIEGGRAALEGSVAGLPKWVLPLLILDPSDDVLRTDGLAQQARDVLSAAGALRARSARRGARGVSSPRAFSLLVRDLVLEAEVQYIRHHSRQRYGTPVPSRPSSNRFSPPVSSWPDRFAFEPDPLGETPDAR
jgi:hypothetical protein